MTARACTPPAGATATRCTSAISIPPIPDSRCSTSRSASAPEGMSLRDARTGKPLFTIPSVKADDSGGDKGEGPGRGVAFNIDPRFPGAESWAAGAGMSGMYDVHGKKFVEGRPAGLSTNFAIWWDGDLLRELLDQNVISQVELADAVARRAAGRAPMHVQQRHQGDAGAVSGYLGRLARGSDLAHARQPGAAHLHLDHSDAASHGHADAGSAVSARDRLAERGLQPATASEFLSRRSGAVAEEAGDPLYARLRSLKLRAHRSFWRPAVGANGTAGLRQHRFERQRLDRTQSGDRVARVGFRARDVGVHGVVDELRRHRLRRLRAGSDPR